MTIPKYQLIFLYNYNSNFSLLFHARKFTKSTFGILNGDYDRNCNLYY